MSKHEEKKKRLRIERIILVVLIIWGIYKIAYSIFFKTTNEEKHIQSQKLLENTQVVTINQNYQIEYVPDTNISMSVIGDIMCHNSQYIDANSNGRYDFSYVFEDIKKYIESSDIAVGNLETTFAGKDIGYSSYPTFNTPEALATDLKELGIDVLSTANNHSLDKGYTGIVRTIAELDKAGIYHTGTYNSEESYNEILMVEAKGVKFAFLAYTYGTNGIPIPKGKEYCINLIDKEKIVSDLNKAKMLEPDIIVVSMHWGIEYQTTPNEEQKELADLLFKNGANIILGSHPHVLQKMEKVEVELESGKKRDGFVIYSLGNFVSGQVKANTRQSVVLNINLTKSGKDNSININSVDYIPIYTFKGSHYRLLDIQNVLNNYNNGDRTYGSGTINTLQTELEQIKSRLGEPIIK